MSEGMISYVAAHMYIMVPFFAWCSSLNWIITYSRLQLSRSPRDPLKYLRDIRTSTYQICRIEEKINPTTIFHKLVYNLTPEVRFILKILWKREAISPLFHNILLPVVRCSCLNRDQIFTAR